MIYNSTRIMNEYSISTIFNEGNRYINNCFNPSGLSVLNEINIKNIGKAIVEAIKKAFKWIWDKLKQLGAFIKKKFTDISNKIRGIDIDIDIKDKVEIIVLDSEKAVKSIADLERAFEVSRMFGKLDAMARGFVRSRFNIINSYISSIKSSRDYAIKNGKDTIHDMNSADDDYNKDSSVVYGKKWCKNYLNKLYEELDKAKEEMKKINNEKLGGFLNLGKQFDVNDICDALKKKYSFYEEDGSLKKEYQKKITIDPSYNSKQYFKKIYDESIELNKALSEACAKNTKKIYDEINDYQELANYIAKAIDESVTIIESIDSTLAEEFAKRTKELAEIAAKKAAEEARIKAEMDRIAAENAAKIAAENARIKAEAEKKAAEAEKKAAQNTEMLAAELSDFKKEIENAKTDSDMYKKILKENYSIIFNNYNVFSEIKFM